MKMIFQKISRRRLAMILWTVAILVLGIAIHTLAYININQTAFINTKLIACFGTFLVSSLLGLKYYINS